LPEDAARRADLLTDFAVNSRVWAAAAPAKDVDRYLHGASPPLDRLERLRPVLVLLDALDDVPEERLETAADEFESIREELLAIRPPRTLETAHELLCRVCVLGASAASMRADPANRDTPSRAWTAASAATGALMLLERARAELGLPAIRK
jgi:hypothetical protein